MTRQVALGAVVAFFVTVIALSVWEPKGVLAPTPAPATAAPARVGETAPAPPPGPANVMVRDPAAFRPAMLRPEGISRAIRAPVVIAQPLVQDAGTP
jgi:hypothetical protein